jgi:hypothetical protein
LVFDGAEAFDDAIELLGDKGEVDVGHTAGCRGGPSSVKMDLTWPGITTRAVTSTPTMRWFW